MAGIRVANNWIVPLINHFVLGESWSVYDVTDLLRVERAGSDTEGIGPVLHGAEEGV